MAANVEVKEVSPMTVAFIHKKDVSREQLGSIISAAAISLMVYTKESGLDVAGPGTCVYYNMENYPWELDICLPVSKAGKPRGEIAFKDLPGGPAAVHVHKGSYEGIPSICEKMGQWAKDNKKQVTQYREVYVKGPQHTKNVDDYETNLVFLIK